MAKHTLTVSSVAWNMSTKPQGTHTLAELLFSGSKALQAPCAQPVDAAACRCALGAGAACRRAPTRRDTGAWAGGGVSTQVARMAAAANAYSSEYSSMIMPVGLPASVTGAPVQ